MTSYRDAPLPKFGDYSTLGVSTPGEIVMVAGQLGADAAGVFPSDACEQVENTFDNIGIALAAVGLGFEHVVGFRTYVVDRATIPEFVKGRSAKYPDLYPTGVYPPNTLLIVAGLVAEEAVVEIEALAVRPAATL
jgi:enamine deaminase RidA (YjgF/YER057c/UK114 family)